MTGFLVLINLMVVTRGNLPTALAILRSQGTATAVFAIAFRFLPMLALIVLAIPLRPLHRRLGRANGIVATLSIFVILTSASGYALALIALGFLVVLWPWIRRKTTLQNALDRRLDQPLWEIGALVALFGTILTIEGGMWVPAERVELSDGTVATAFVLNENDDTIHLLIEDTRRIELVSADTITSRAICELGGGSWYRPLLFQLSDRQDYPARPER